MNMEKYMKILLAFLVLLAGGCTKDFLDINTNPNYPTKATLPLLLTNIEKNVADGLTIKGGLSNITAVYMHQITTRESPDQYGINGSSSFTQSPWDFFYAGPLQDIELLISQAEADENVTYAGIGKILKVYLFSQMVDVYGDIPFSEANKLDADNLGYPVWDKSENIYPALFALLNKGIADLQNTTASNNVTPGGDDVIYAGSKAKWLRAAKTLKLKLYNQVRLVQNVTAFVNIPSDSLIQSGEDFEFQYKSKSSPDERNPGFLEYEAGQKGYYQSPWFHEILKGMNPEIFTGIVDPRIPYYTYNQLQKTQDTREGNPTEYRDGAFVSIVFGSISKNRDHSTDGSMSLMGLYPVGGRYDDGKGMKVTGNHGTGAAPYRFITYADRLFIQAELANAGLIADNNYFKTAVEASFKQVDHVVTLVNPSAALTTQTTPPTMWVPAAVAPVPPAAATTGWLVKDYITKVMALYDAATTTQKLEYIMTEKWISQYGCNVDTWTDYRRTGYPIVFNPKDPIQAPDGIVMSPDGFEIPVTLINKIPWTVVWPQSELSLNPNAPAQKDPGTFKVFYDKH
jgi:hypothetical protein